jgi:hypothetical protein
MSAIFQRPLCEMGRAYDYSFRPWVGEPAVGDGGPCDERPTSMELYGARTDPSSPSAAVRAFLLCPEHASQLARYDAQLVAKGMPSRFKPRTR